MRIIGLWNPDHLSKQTALISTIDPNITGFLVNESTNYNLFSAQSMISNWWAWNVVNFNNRSWINVQCSTSVSLTAHFVLAQPMSATAYPEFRATGAKRVYHGLRIYVVSCKSGATLLNINGVNTYTPANGTEYFVEVVDDLEANTRRIYVNGGSVSTVPDGNVIVGSLNGSMLNISGHRYYLTDYYLAIAEATDVTPSVRLGKMSIKTLPPTGLLGGDKFTAVGSGSTIPALLGAGRAALAPSGIADYVTSDSNGGKATLSFTAPNTGSKVVGAAIRVLAMREPAAQANAWADTGGGPKQIGVPLTTTSSSLPTPTPMVVVNPTNGWSEAELGNVTAQIWSTRTV